MALEIVEVVDRLGGTHDWTSAASGVEVLRGPNGRFMPTFELSNWEVPGQPGARLRRIKTKSRRFSLPVVFTGANSAALRQKIREVASYLNPDLGTVVIRCTAPDGIQRELSGYYSSGLELDEDLSMNTWQKAILNFDCFDPYWYASASVSASFAAATAGAFFPFFPLRLGSSTVFADLTIQNNGDVQTWPVWTIDGPGTDLVLRNLTSGEVLSLSGTIADGETITIDTSPGVKTVLNTAGASLFSSLGDPPSLWPIVRGSNTIRIEMSATDTNSLVSYAYRERYFTP